MNTVWTIGGILTWTKQYFSDKGVDNPRLDAEVLLSHILRRDRLYLYVHYDQPLEKHELAAYREAVKRRVLHFPVAYITGRKEFMGKEFIVSPDVLIPRPDTEILVETLASYLKTEDHFKILDIGTGSGAIIISLLLLFPNAEGHGVDISEKALMVAHNNADQHGVSNRLTFVSSDIFESITGQTFDVIVSNPPYIKNDEIEKLEPEVRKEPRHALAGGHDGLDFYRRIISEAPRFLRSGGILGFEVGIGQARLVADAALRTGWYEMIKIVNDYGGVERVVLLRLLEDKNAYKVLEGKYSTT